MAGVVRVLDAVSASGAPVRGVVRRLGEPVQFDPELLGQLKQAGVVPGAMAVFRNSGPYVLVEVEGADGGLELPSEVAGHIFIAKNP